MNLDILKAYKIIENIELNGAYSSIELNKQLTDKDNKKLITKIVYGYLDNYIKYSYFLLQLVNKNPKPKIRIILKLGMYLVNEINSMPIYAVVNNLVDLTKKIGKKNLAGFVNAVLKKLDKTEFNMPRNEIKKMSIEYSKPQIYIDELINRVGKEKTIEILKAKQNNFEHIRVNINLYSIDKLIKFCKENEIEFTESEVQGLFVKNNAKVQELYAKGFITYQAVNSIKAVKAMDLTDKSAIWDYCSAPGGKAMLMAEICPKSTIYATDIHEHRVELIKKYASRMQLENIKANLISEVEKDFENKFDYILCDVPCSGFGVLNKRPDIMLNRNQEDVNELTKIQMGILNNAKTMLKSGGVLVYSTCTILKKENEDIINKFIEENDDFVLDNIKFENKPMITYLPNEKGGEGFFIARMIKK